MELRGRIDEHGPEPEPRLYDGGIEDGDPDGDQRAGSNTTTRTVRWRSRLRPRSASSASPAAGQSVQFTDTSTGSRPPGLELRGRNDEHGPESEPRLHDRGSEDGDPDGDQRYGLEYDDTDGSGCGRARRSFSYTPASPPRGSRSSSRTHRRGADAWSWNFGDGSTSTAQNPSHAYTTAGSKTVTLTATNATGSNTTTRTVQVAVALAASFSYTPASPAAGQSVQFTDTSTGGPTAWSWNFGDGINEHSPESEPRLYDGGIEDGDPDGDQRHGLEYDDTDGSGCGRTHGVLQLHSRLPSRRAVGPVHGHFDGGARPPGHGTSGTDQRARPESEPYICIFGFLYDHIDVSNSSGSTYAAQVINVLPASTLSASFTYSPASPPVGQTVQFTDTSTGSPTGWSWNFGDGSTSTVQNPSHAYTMAGSKTVTLTATNASGSNSISRPLTVVSSSAIIIDHNSAKLANIPSEWITAAKQNLHIAYGHTSHGSQLTTGMAGLVQWKGTQYAWNFGGTGAE